MTGQTINNYTLERKLGEGGMGDVYFARHNRIDRVVAIKVLHQNLFTNESIRSRFKNEANALIKLGHPNIVKIYDYVEQDDFACLIMEYIDGFTLDDYITKITGPLPAPKATSIIGNVLDAVQYAHDNNIFHRDIKPGNIMVSKDGRMVRIMDFSIAKFTDAANLKTTHANAQLGTPFYMSPEQVKGMGFTGQSDIYSLGVTLFEMVTGKCPYLEITNLFELQSKIVNEPLPPTNKYYPEVSSKIQEAIKIATNKAPEQRFKNCSEFKNYLMEEEKLRPDSVLKQSQPTVPKPQQTKLKISGTKQIRPQQIIEERKKRNGWVYLLVGLLIIVGGSVIISFLGKSDVSTDYSTSKDNSLTQNPETRIKNDPLVIKPDADTTTAKPSLKDEGKETVINTMTKDTVKNKEAKENLNKPANDPAQETATKKEEPVKKTPENVKEISAKEESNIATANKDGGNDKNYKPNNQPDDSTVIDDFKKHLKAGAYEELNINYTDIDKLSKSNVGNGQTSGTGNNIKFKIFFKSKGHEFTFQVTYSNVGNKYRNIETKLL